MNFKVLALAGLILAIHVARSENTNICGVCKCQNMTVNYLIDCSKLKLTDHFTKEDWDETFAVTNLNRSTLLDVRFDSNQITEIHKFPPLRIQSLYFSDNLINYIDSTAFVDLDDLVAIDLSHNNLTSESLPEDRLFGRFNGSDHYLPLPWEHLSLSHNYIHSIEKDLFDHLPFLITLDLSFNPLKVLGGSTMQAISQLRQLKVLDLAQTSIKTIPEGMLHALKYLESLNLADNFFDKVPEEISNCHNLTVLTLDGNKFETLNQWSFSGLDSLDELSISNMPTLKMIETRTFGPLKKLQKLHCANNRKLTRLADDAFLDITPDPKHWPVREMYLNDNALTVLVKELAAWEYVEILDIQNNPFVCDCKIEWMAEVLLPEIRSATPEYANGITCHEPVELRGREILSMSYEHEEFINCDTGSRNLDGDIRIQPYSFTAAGIAVMSIGIILIVIGLSLLGVLIVKRRAIEHGLMHREGFIRYERAETDEDEYRHQPNNRKF